jgi:hypothetical protein
VALRIPYVSAARTPREDRRKGTTAADGAGTGGDPEPEPDREVDLDPPPCVSAAAPISSTLPLSAVTSASTLRTCAPHSAPIPLAGGTKRLGIEAGLLGDLGEVGEDALRWRISGVEDRPVSWVCLELLKGSRHLAERRGDPVQRRYGTRSASMSSVAPS